MRRTPWSVGTSLTPQYNVPQIWTPLYSNQDIFDHKMRGSTVCYKLSYYHDSFAKFIHTLYNAHHVGA